MPIPRLGLRLPAASAGVALAIAPLCPVSAQTFNTIYTFTNSLGEGGGTYGPLLLTSSGTLLGTALAFQGQEQDMLFSLTPPSQPGGTWTLSALLIAPGFMGGPLTPSGGSLFTFGPGTANGGSINEISVNPGSGLFATTIFDFNDGTTGYEPNQLLASGGNLLGTATLGGASNMGTIFELTPPPPGSTVWGGQTLHTFTGQPSDGQGPYGPLVLGSGGGFYGTTTAGGTFNAGAVFSLTPPASQGGPWTEAIIYNCTSASAGPEAALLVEKNGVLYGTAGGITPGTRDVRNGSVFALHPPTEVGGAWTLKTLHAFTGEPDGNGPVGTLVVDSEGALYGATFRGGASNKGMVYKLTPPTTQGGEWTETTLHSFSGPDGHNPYYGVTVTPSGTVYGATNYGGAGGDGVIYQIVQ